MNFKTFAGCGIFLLAIYISAPALAIRVIDEDFNELTLSFSFNGSAFQDTTPGNVRLTQSSEWQAGSLFFNTPFQVSAFRARFDFWTGGGAGEDNNGEGLTFAVLDAAVSGPASLGGNGSGLGYEGLSGLAIEFDTWNSGQIDQESENHVGVDINGSVASIFINSSYIPELENSPDVFNVIISFQNGNIKVFLRNRQISYPWTKVVDFTIPGFVPYRGYFGFTAATGGATNVHEIDNFSLDIFPGIPSAPAKNSASLATMWGSLKTKN
ncbi:hypothetical protein HYR99_41285 [Candidatus Poribacteria bacterium]|nr:hypothetical protein [Candidatus Poribacteria bacterium]